MESPFLSDAGLWESWKGDRPPSSAGRGLGRPASARSTRVNSGVTIERHNMGAMKLNLYYGRDLFHTLINMPGYRFLLIFLVVYLSMYLFFTLLYYSQPRDCISNTTTFLHVLWFSVHTAATIGYGHMAPHPECTTLNVFVMLQVLTCLLLQATLLGVVYARFSTPNARAHTIRFSRVMTLHTGSDGYDRLSFRVANLRKHQVLRPELRMLLLRRWQGRGSGGVGGAGEEWVYTDLPTRHSGGSGQVWLGVPTVLRHVVDESSPLHGMRLQDMERWGWEIVVLLDGYDESTSMPVQARQSYRAQDIQQDTRFEPMVRRNPSGFLGVDFNSFDLTHHAAGQGEGSSEEGDASEAPAYAADKGPPLMRSHDTGVPFGGGTPADAETGAAR